MKSCYNRFGVYEFFFCNTQGSSLFNRIHNMARHHVSRHVAKIDSNWHSVEIRFNDAYRPKQFSHRTLAEQDACKVEFDFRPSEFTLVGPKVGHVDLREQMFDMIPEPVLLLMRACDAIKPWFHTLDNPKHAIELIDGKTIIVFENCTSGVVRNVRGEEFDVEYFGETLSAGQVEHYTLQRLHEEMKMDALRGQAVDVSYFPYLPYEGTSRNTAEEVNAVCRDYFEKRRAEEAQRHSTESSG